MLERLEMAPDDVSFMRSSLSNIQDSVNGLTRIVHDLAVKVSVMDQRDETIITQINGLSKELSGQSEVLKGHMLSLIHI